MVRFAKLALLALAGTSLTGMAAAQDVGFCASYQQTKSNAGDCPTCSLAIADNPEIQKYFVEANNGWKAELTWIEGDASVAEGQGQWPAEMAPPYGGKTFDIQMTQQGRTLQMSMTVVGGELGTIEAEFICNDPQAPVPPAVRSPVQRPNQAPRTPNRG